MIAGGLDRNVRPGEIVQLSAEGSTDPDGDNLSYHWWQYYDAGDVKTKIAINNATSKNNASLVVPDEAGKNFHVILEVTDDGEPILKNYQRIIFKIE